MSQTSESNGHVKEVVLFPAKGKRAIIADVDTSAIPAKDLRRAIREPERTVRALSRWSPTVLAFTIAAVLVGLLESNAGLHLAGQAVLLAWALIVALVHARLWLRRRRFIRKYVRHLSHWRTRAEQDERDLEVLWEAARTGSPDAQWDLAMHLKRTRS